MVAVGLILPNRAFILFRHEDTEFNPTWPVSHVVVTCGPYQFTRNPMYVALIILALGIAVWTGARPMFIVPHNVFAILDWAHIPFGGQTRRQFGSTYEDYVVRVRRWL